MLSAVAVVLTIPIGWGVDVGETTAPSGLPTIRAPTGWLREAQRFSVRIRFETAPSLRQGIAIVLVLGLATDRSSFAAGASSAEVMLPPAARKPPSQATFLLSVPALTARQQAASCFSSSSTANSAAPTATIRNPWPRPIGRVSNRACMNGA